MSDHVMLLSLVVFLPALAALVIAFMPGSWIDPIRYFTLAVTAVVMALAVLGFLDPFGSCVSTKYDVAQAEMQSLFNISWIPSFDIDYFMGLDGISFPLVML